MRTQLSILIGVLLCTPIFAHAIANKCNRNIAIGNTQGLCQGVQLPYEQTRGRSGNRLVCTGNVDHFVRRPQDVPNYGEWSALIKNEGSHSQAAFDLRQKQPLIEWKGRIPYAVIEEWDWIECSSGFDRGICGYHTVCKDVPYTYETCDRQNRCTTHSGSRNVCEDVTNECYFDHPRHASMHCSQEALNYTAHFERDKNWSPKSPEFNEFIPNKYDLLPGEIEDVQVFNTTGTAGRLNPTVVVGDAWNTYDWRSKMSGSAIGAACRQGANETLDIPIVTVGRIKKPSPNAFRLPVDIEGKPIRPLVWVVDEENTKGYPKTLRLSDTSSSMVSLIARQSRDNADREVVKEEVGKGGNPDTMKLDSKKGEVDPFFKNTILRVQLLESTWIGESAFSKPFYVGDADAIVSANLSLSKIQDVRNSDRWEIPLDDEAAGMNLYKRDTFVARMLGATHKPLKPSQTYLLSFSMFQKNVPFYAQSCNENQSKDRCISEPAGVFSKPMTFGFRTSAKYDARPFWQKLNEFTLVDYFHRKFGSPSPDVDDADKKN